MNQGQVEVRVLVKGRPVTEFHHQNQVFIEGRPGSEFEIQVINRTATRSMAVISVDGLSVVDGEPAGEDSSGYVIPAYGTITIPGWMLDNNSVAKFTFSSRKDSYAQQGPGNALNCGVIGVMLIAEKQKPTPYQYGMLSGGVMRGLGYGASSMSHLGNPTWSATTATTASDSYVVPQNTAGISLQSAAVNNLGTEFGKQTQFQSVEAAFEKGLVVKTAVLNYDDSKGLKARGIVLERPSRQYLNTTPNPFPASTSGCVPPKNWKP
jgi:hypothetical protein